RKRSRDCGRWQSGQEGLVLLCSLDSSGAELSGGTISGAERGKREKQYATHIPLVVPQLRRHCGGGGGQRSWQFISDLRRRTVFCQAPAGDDSARPDGRETIRTQHIQREHRPLSQYTKISTVGIVPQ